MNNLSWPASTSSPGQPQHPVPQSLRQPASHSSPAVNSPANLSLLLTPETGTKSRAVHYSRSTSITLRSQQVTSLHHQQRPTVPGQTTTSNLTAATPASSPTTGNLTTDLHRHPSPPSATIK
ncbi:hypothetical protein HNY73_009948 [Argiope bruennichi]|uniref:Uncharacterized protein n=1 Tax=Argiope bruennichi TaxID=94029 RepID=A0A8T0F5D0_ARGBR|nr:hypothetical protein HNY73_009948 [Argiope bruennichi]